MIYDPDSRLVSELNFEKFQRMVLFVLMFLYFSRAAQVYLEPNITNPDFNILFEMIPTNTRVILWILCGAVCGYSGIKNQTELGFFFAMLMPTERMVSYLWSAVTFVNPKIDGGSASSFAWLMWWFNLDLIIFLVACWPELQSQIYCRRKRRQ